MSNNPTAPRVHGRNQAIAWIAILLLGALTFATLAAPHADAKPKTTKAKKKKKKPNTAKVMTRNLYLGADLGPAINASSTDDFINKNGQILRDVDANNFRVRAKGLADEIKKVNPDLIGLQEVALWRTGPVNLAAATGGPKTATTVHIDYLKELMAQVNKGKKRYRVVRVQQQFDFEAPADYNGVEGDGTIPAVNSNGEIDGRLTMRDVILAKVGSSVKTKNVKSGNFETIYTPVISGIPVRVDRGWLSADVKVRKGKWFRFVNTHLEAFGEPTIRETQAKELLAKGGALRSGGMPAVLVGDLNSDDNTVSGDDSLAYNALKTGGMVDRGTKKMTFGVASGIITADAPGKFNQTIDHVMTNRPKSVRLLKSGVTGTKPVAGYWNSDHLGVWSNLKMP